MAKTLQIPSGVWVLGFVSMLMDISSEMIHSLLPMFMVTALGTSAFVVGLVDGLAESTALIVKIFSGSLSDYLGKRKGLAVFGYTLGALAKPLFAIAPTAGVVPPARLLDRVAKGIRSAPRDALAADLAPPRLRGAAFGLRQSLDTVGAFLGPLLAVGLMLLLANNFRSVFWVAVVPGLAAVGLLALRSHAPAHLQACKCASPIRREKYATPQRPILVGGWSGCGVHNGPLQRSVMVHARAARDDGRRHHTRPSMRHGL